MTLPSEIWLRLSADPRAHPELRASDADRGVVFDAVGEAYAQGLLDADEHTERLDAAGAIKTFGEIPPLISDIVAPAPETTAGSTGTTQEQARARLALQNDSDAVPTTPEEIDAAARAYWKTMAISSATAFAAPSAICVAIWLFTWSGSGHAVFFWPLFVILGTGGGFFSTLLNRDRMIRDRKRKLTMRARAQLGDSEAQSEIEAHPAAYSLDDLEGKRTRREQRRRRQQRHYGELS